MRRRGWALRCGLMVVFILASSSIVVGQAPNGTKVVDEKTAGDVSLKAGERLEVHLAANHTTGYSWVQAPVEKPVLQKLGKAIYKEDPSDGKAGVGGMEIWKFKAVRAGTQNLKFEYRRPWERAPHAEKTLSFDVTVQ